MLAGFHHGIVQPAYVGCDSMSLYDMLSKKHDDCVLNAPTCLVEYLV